MADEQASREYINQMWAEAMEIYRSGNFRLRFSPAMNAYLKAHQKDFMPEDTKAGQILDYLERYSGSIVCSKQYIRIGHIIILGNISDDRKEITQHTTK